MHKPDQEEEIPGNGNPWMQIASDPEFEDLDEDILDLLRMLQEMRIDDCRF